MKHGFCQEPQEIIEQQRQRQRAGGRGRGRGAVFIIRIYMTLARSGSVHLSSKSHLPNEQPTLFYQLALFSMRLSAQRAPEMGCWDFPAEEGETPDIS